MLKSSLAQGSDPEYLRVEKADGGVVIYDYGKIMQIPPKHLDRNSKKDTELELPHKCPVCGETEFSSHGSFEICDVCGWEDDLVQETEPDETNCANEMSLNQAREYWKKYHKSVLDN